MCLTCHRAHHADHGTCNSCHGGNDRTTRKQVAHDNLVAGRLARHHIRNSPAVARGSKLIETLACRRCHTSGKTGNRLSGDLDRVSAHRHPLALEESILHPAENMPDFRLNRENAADIVNAIMAKRAAAGTTDLPLVLRFRKKEGAGSTIFARKCGACHRALTSRHGPQGEGDIGPNLSGLLSRFYPATFENDRPWNVERLQKWLHNPRLVRPHAMMKPVPVKNSEFKELLEVLGRD
ncbi:Cytochrome c [Geobacter sp. DSM 9736]|nr:Cytochrome c [Geobacter sp. DSM 9736]